MTAHRLPLLGVQLTGLSKYRRVDGDLAEIVESSGPPEACDVGAGQAERLCELVDVLGYPVRVPEGVRVALVHDVRERFEGTSRLPPEGHQPLVRAVDGEDERHERHGGPRLGQG